MGCAEKGRRPVLRLCREERAGESGGLAKAVLTPLGRALAVGEGAGREPSAPPRQRERAGRVVSPGAFLAGTFCRGMMERLGPVKNNSPAAAVHPGSAAPVVPIHQPTPHPNDAIAVKSGAIYTFLAGKWLF